VGIVVAVDQPFDVPDAFMDFVVVVVVASMAE